MTPGDVMSLVTAQLDIAGAEKVVRVPDGTGGFSSATIKRRLVAAVSSLYGAPPRASCGSSPATSVRPIRPVDR